MIAEFLSGLVLRHVDWPTRHLSGPYAAGRCIALCAPLVAPLVIFALGFAAGALFGGRQ